MNGGSNWGWNTDRSARRTPGGLAWLKPFSAAVPWITVGLLLLMLYLLGGTYTAARGVLFDLPATAGAAEGEQTSLVAVVMALPQKTLVVFDDAPFEISREAADDGADDSPLSAFGRQLEERARHSSEKTLLLLADRRVAGGDLMKLATVARASGIDRILFAERKLEERTK